MAGHAVSNPDQFCVFQTFKNPKGSFLAALRDSGPVPGDENGHKNKRAAQGEESAKKKKRTDKNVGVPALVNGIWY